MKSSIGIFAALILMAMPLLAQDDAQQPVFGAGGDQAQVFTRIDTSNPMDQVKGFLAKANITLNGDQEKTLRPAVEAALKEAQDVAERMRAQSGGGSGPRGAEGGRRGGPGSGGSGFAANNPLVQELRRINDDLIAKITAVLKPDQQAAFKKFQNDEIRKAGGFAALKLVMAEAGAPLSAEQEPQIQALYNEDAQQRLQLPREGQGRPDAGKLTELERTTMGKVVKLLTPAQRKALLDSRPKSP